MGVFLFTVSRRARALHSDRKRSNGRCVTSDGGSKSRVTIDGGSSNNPSWMGIGGKFRPASSLTCFFLGPRPLFLVMSNKSKQACRIEAPLLLNTRTRQVRTLQL